MQDALLAPSLYRYGPAAHLNFLDFLHNVAPDLKTGLQSQIKLCKDLNNCNWIPTYWLYKMLTFRGHVQRLCADIQYYLFLKFTETAVGIRTVAYALEGKCIQSAMYSL